jgi:ATP-dependent DNA helicase RecG
VLDLLRLFPKRHENRLAVQKCAAVRREAVWQGVFRGALKTLKVARLGGRKCIIWATFADDSGSLRARWYNQPWLQQSLVEGQEYFLFGLAGLLKDEVILENPEIETVVSDFTPPQPNALTPVYGVGKALREANVSPRLLRKLIVQALADIDWKQSFPTLDPDQPFAKLKRALYDLHWPVNPADGQRARETMAFFDHVLFQLGVLRRREALTGVLTLPETAVASTEVLPPSPFPLTTDQKTVCREILADLRGERPMNRLLQGDVGSGKTIAAFLAMTEFCVHQVPGAQSVFMAPTDVLAQQQYRSFGRFFPHLASRAILLTGSTKGAERNKALALLASGEAVFVFGTHSLFQESVTFSRLGFCVVDEQHKFGVEQRRALVRKGSGKTPHLLMISATPIPRSLSLTIFGDMDVSIVKTMPPGRLPIQTHLAQTWEKVIEPLAAAFSQHRQAYYICPLVDASTKTAWASVTSAMERIVQRLPEARVERLTGRDTPERTAEIMAAFGAGAIDLLVATTVVEVGIDNPNAVVLVVENADRFGLSQLHQLRGRIGRGSAASHCYLISDQASECERLRILLEHLDGFAIAQEDLRLRGPGDLVGTRQSGLLHPAFANLARLDLVEKARKRAGELLTENPGAHGAWFLERMRESFGQSFETFMEGG